jgi:parallel beta helix pectate lyase-like protein
VKLQGPIWLGLILSSFVFGGAEVWAQATRTWVSGVGDDANPCSRTAPCKTFAGAISKTAAAGEINVLDPGGFGAVTITKSISIEADGEMAGVLVSGTNAIIVNAGAADRVVLRGLTIEGLKTGLRGVSFLAGGSLVIEKCTINQFTYPGISFTPSGASSLYVKDTVVRNNLGANAGGILVQPGASGSAFVSLDGVRIENNEFGLQLSGSSVKATVRNSQAIGSLGHGVFANATGGAAIEVTLDSCLLALNSLSGLRSSGSSAVARIGAVTVTGNAIGLDSANAGQIVSWGDNHVYGNTTDGQPTSTVSPR